MTENLIIGLFAYVSIAGLFGAFSSCYAATLTQRIGIAALSIWSAWCAYIGYQTESTPHHAVLGGVGMAVFATGTIIKTYRFKVRNEKDC